jgi:hypothetical protein
MQRLLSRYDGRDVQFAICDVAANPQQAARDHVVFTPSLVKRHPGPRLWVFGDLAHANVVADILSACGVTESPR